MKRLLLVLVLALAACGGSDDVWGGYTENEAKDVIADPRFRQSVLENAPGDPATSPYRQLLPTKDEVDAADLRKVTYKGQEAWEYRNEDANFCIDVWEDPEIDNFGSYVGVCDSD